MHAIVSAYSWGRRVRAAQPGEVDLATSKQYAVSHSLLHDCADSNTLPKTFVAFEILNVPTLNSCCLWHSPELYSAHIYRFQSGGYRTM